MKTTDNNGMKSSANGNARKRRLYFARRIVYSWERPSIIRKHIYTGAMGSIWVSLISGIFFVYYGTRIGVTPFQWGLMGCISSWLAVSQLLSALMTEKTRKRKLLWFWFAVIDRALRMVGILLSFWLWYSGWPSAATLLIIFICLSNLFGNLASPPWMSWLADIIPEEEHGKFWGKRSAWIALSTVGVVIPAGFLFDRIPVAYKPHVLIPIFLFATAVGILDLVIHGTIPEPKMAKSLRSSFARGILQPLSDENFRPWLLFNFCWTFSMTLGGALSTIYFIEDLGIKDNFVGGTIVLATFSLIGSIFSGGWSGKLVDRYGSRPILFLGHFFWAFLPIFWFFATPQTALILLGLGSLVGGVSSTAATTASSKLITRLPPQGQLAMYAAASSTLGSFAGGLGILTAGSLLKLLENWSAPSFSGELGAFRLLFLVSSSLRMISTLFLAPRIRYEVKSSNNKGAFSR